MRKSKKRSFLAPFVTLDRENHELCSSLTKCGRAFPLKYEKLASHIILYPQRIAKDSVGHIMPIVIRYTTGTDGTGTAVGRKCEFLISCYIVDTT